VGGEGGAVAAHGSILGALLTSQALSPFKSGLLCRSAARWLLPPRLPTRELRPEGGPESVAQDAPSGVDSDVGRQVRETKAQATIACWELQLPGTEPLGTP
jgi:hypothetical protein